MTTSVFHPDAGSESGVVATVAIDASDAGAELSMPERCVTIELGADVATVTTDRRTVRAERVVIAAGPWSGDLLRMIDIELPLAPAVAQVTFLEAPQLVDRPGFVDWLRDDRVGVYGHPVPGIGYKVAFDAASTEPWLPTSRVAARPRRAGPAHPVAEQRMPAVDQRPFLQRHPWTMTPDGDFAIGRRGWSSSRRGAQVTRSSSVQRWARSSPMSRKVSAGMTSSCSRWTGRR